MRSLHELNVIHRDLKLDNILLKKENDSDDESGLLIKIADLGFAK